jgi:hypothetical protein
MTELNMESGGPEVLEMKIGSRLWFLKISPLAVRPSLCVEVQRTCEVSKQADLLQLPPRKGCVEWYDSLGLLCIKNLPWP